MLARTSLAVIVLAVATQQAFAVCASGQMGENLFTMAVLILHH